MNFTKVKKSRSKKTNNKVHTKYQKFYKFRVNKPSIINPMALSGRGITKPILKDSGVINMKKKSIGTITKEERDINLIAPQDPRLIVESNATVIKLIKKTDPLVDSSSNTKVPSNNPSFKSYYQSMEDNLSQLKNQYTKDHINTRIDQFNYEPTMSNLALGAGVDAASSLLLPVGIRELVKGGRDLYMKSHWDTQKFEKNLMHNIANDDILNYEHDRKANKQMINSMIGSGLLSIGAGALGSWLGIPLISTAAKFANQYFMN